MPARASERATIFIIARSDHDKDTRRVSLSRLNQPTRACKCAHPRLRSLIFFPRFPRALPGIIGNPLLVVRLILAPGAGGSLSDTILPPALEFSQNEICMYALSPRPPPPPPPSFPSCTIALPASSHRRPAPFYVRVSSFPAHSPSLLSGSSPHGLSFANSIPLIMQSSQISVISS